MKVDELIRELLSGNSTSFEPVYVKLPNGDKVDITNVDAHSWGVVLHIDIDEEELYDYLADKYEQEEDEYE